MYFSKIVPTDPSRVAMLLRNEYAIHQLVWGWFSHSTDQSRDFLYRVDTDKGVCIYTYSSEPPHVDDSLFQCESKLFNYVPRVGEHLDFVVRVNPVVSKCTQSKRGTRHDVVMAAKKARIDRGQSVLPNSEIEHQEIGKWVSMRAAKNGFSVNPNTLRVSCYTPRSLNKRGNGAVIQVTTADVQGTLTVIDAEMFSALLKQGLGPAKGFGCGLLMVKPA